jgi:nucleoporin NUP82
MLAMYETIDLGLVSMLSRISSSLLDLLQGNHPLFLVDPIHEGVIHIYHAFGVHSVHLGPMLHSITAALRAGDEEGDEDDRLLTTALEKAAGTVVRSVLNTLSFERQSVDIYWAVFGLTKVTLLSGAQAL